MREALTKVAQPSCHPTACNAPKAYQNRICRTLGWVSGIQKLTFT
jgi:hypothetical protein